MIDPIIFYNSLFRDSYTLEIIKAEIEDQGLTLTSVNAKIDLMLSKIVSDSGKILKSNDQFLTLNSRFQKANTIVERIRRAYVIYSISDEENNNLPIKEQEDEKTIKTLDNQIDEGKFLSFNTNDFEETSMKKQEFIKETNYADDM